MWRRRQTSRGLCCNSAPSATASIGRKSVSCSYDDKMQHSDAMCIVLGKSLTAGGHRHLPRTFLIDVLTVAEDVVWQTKAVRLLDQSLDAYWRLNCGWFCFKLGLFNETVQIASRGRMFAHCCN